MKMAETIGLIVGVLGFLSTIITLIFTRRKLGAEREKLLAEAESARSGAASTDVDAFDKFSDLLKKLQDRNDELYGENVALEVAATERNRTIEQLQLRLSDRDAQLLQATKQLELLRELAKSVPISDTLRSQLESMNVIVANLQDAQKQMQEVLLERDKAISALMESNRNLAVKA